MTEKQPSGRWLPRGLCAFRVVVAYAATGDPKYRQDYADADTRIKEAKALVSAIEKGDDEWWQPAT